MHAATHAERAPNLQGVCLNFPASLDVLGTNYRASLGKMQHALHGEWLASKKIT